MSATTAERLRLDGIAQRQNLLGNTRFGAGLGWDFDANGVPLLTVGSMEQTQHGPEPVTVRFEDLHGDAIRLGSLGASRDGPSLGDPLWEWVYTNYPGPLSLLRSDDGTATVQYLDLDHEAQLLTIGSPSAQVALYGLGEGELVVGVGGGVLAGMALPEGNIPIGGPYGAPVALPPNVDGYVLQLVAGSPAWVDPEDLGIGGGPVVRRIMHLVSQASRGVAAGSNIRNIYDSDPASNAAVTSTAPAGTSANVVYSSTLNLQGLRCQVPAGSANNHCNVRGARHEAPLKQWLNAGSTPVTVNGQGGWYMRSVDTVLFRRVTTSHASEISMWFGMGMVTTQKTVGCFVGFEGDRTSTDITAVIWSGVGGVSTYHMTQTLTGFAVGEAHRLEVRLVMAAGVKSIEWYVNGTLAHTWSPPVGTDINFGTEVPNDSTWSTWWSCYVANSTNAAETWGLLEEGCMVDVVEVVDTIAA